MPKRRLASVSVVLFAVTGPALCQSLGPDVGGGSMQGALQNIFESAGQYTAMKAKLGTEIHFARSAFFRGCARGEHDPAVEARFADLLLQKDLFYLVLQVSETFANTFTSGRPIPATPGMPASRVEAIDQVTGGPLDGGIPPRARPAFDAWANSVTQRLGPLAALEGAALKDPVARAALEATPEYKRYKQLRDQSEYVRGRALTAVHVPPATTPEQFADVYLRAVLEPAIDKIHLDPATAPDQLAAVDAWKLKVRDAIVDYERVTFGIDDAVANLKRAGYSEDQIAFFRAELDRRSRSGAQNMSDAIVDAYVATSRKRDAESGHPSSRGPNPDVVFMTLHNPPYAQGPGKLTPEQASALGYQGDASNYMNYLFGPGQPIKFQRWPYEGMRSDIAQGKLSWPRPAPPPGSDPCTGVAPQGQTAGGGL